MKRAEKASSSLRVVWVGSKDEKEKVLKYAREQGLEPVVYDQGESLSSRFSIQSGAGFVLVSRSGRLRAKVDGALSRRELDGLLARAFGSDGGAGP
ncbi:MAG: hypothetical protein HYZ28_10955 [Myxococcales bacterium]|nr:hypothetical protein [Myxococcales bacterium]